jgi:hypothetical protein
VELGLKFAVLTVLAATAVQSVFVPRGLYADGAYSLWLILNTNSFVFIGWARSFVIFLNQFPVVLAMWLGEGNLDRLISYHSFGVAAMPVIIWLVALFIQLRGQFFWPLTLIYSATFLATGFIAIGEYTYSFALVALVVSLLVARAPVRGWRALCLVFASVALVLAYEGMAFLGLPIVLLILVRLFRGPWIACGPTDRRERLVLWTAFGCAVSSVLVAAGSIGIRTLNSADTNLAGALNVSFAFDSNHQLRLVALLALLMMLSLFIRQPLIAGVLHFLLGMFAIQLFFSSVWAPAWLHYSSRSLAAMIFFVLLLAALLALFLGNYRLTLKSELRRTGARLHSVTFGVTTFVLLASMSIAFSAMSLGYLTWLQDLRGVVISSAGPVDIASTNLYGVDNSQFSWGWTNPYLSALLQTRDGQGLVISHVETLDNFSPISPPSSPEFFHRYYR